MLSYFFSGLVTFPFSSNTSLLNNILIDHYGNEEKIALFFFITGKFIAS
jgi:hypothetical protein